MQQALRNRRVLVVEDEFYLAKEISSALRAEGATIVGPVGSSETAMDVLAEQRIDCAVLDIRLLDGTIFPVAKRLREQGVPFLFATGYSNTVIPDQYSSVPHYLKPLDLQGITQQLRDFVPVEPVDLLNRFSYRVYAYEGFWQWDVFSGPEKVASGFAATNITARVAAMRAAARHFL